MIDFQKRFDNNFREYRGKHVVLYGLGVYTQKIIENVSGYDFSVVAERSVGELFCGKPICSLDVLEDTSIVVIVAIPKSVKIIYDRIRKQLSNSCCIYDVAGRRLDDRLDSIALDSYYSLGEKVFGPMTTLFIQEIVQRIQATDGYYLLSSRDCYFPYRMIRKYWPELSERVCYFYISRSASTIASLYEANDVYEEISKVGKMTMGDACLALSERLGIDVIQYHEKKSEFDIRKMCECHMKEILEKADNLRKSYTEYFENRVGKNDRVFFVDLVTQGTNYNALKKIVDRKIELLSLAFRDTDIEFNPETSILPAIDIFSNDNLAHFYQLLEIVLASSEGQVASVEQGTIKFRAGTEYAYEYVKEIQEGMEAYLRLHITDTCNYHEADAALGLLWNLNADTRKELAPAFVYNDAYSSDKEVNIWQQLL